MRAIRFFGMLLLVPATAYAGDKIEPLNVKAGLWEVTTTTNPPSGKPTIPAEQLEKLSPEQRAQVEQYLKSRASQPAKTRIAKHCLTEEDVKKTLFDDLPQNASCHRTVITSTSHESTVRETCMEQGQNLSLLYHVTALDAENVKGEFKSENSGESNWSVSGEFTAKRIGAMCEKTERDESDRK
jgi:hypothetical protein